MYCPVVLADNAFDPIATLKSPVVMASNALIPNEVFEDASSVVLDGSLPIYMEPDSTKASDNPLMSEAAALCTNAVVAICVVFVPLAAVGAVGVPVKIASAIGAFKFKLTIPEASIAST